jgi:RimJ/RimL family protein N-acetyltransferase
MSEFVTDRLALLPLEVAHADELAVALADPALHSFIGGEPMSVADLRERYEHLVAGSPDPGVTWRNWATRLLETGELVGTVQATVTGAREAEIAWVVGTPWQRRGIASEAAQAVVSWLEQRGVSVFVAHIHPDHRASASVAAAAGLAATDHWHDGEVRWERQSEGLRAAGPRRARSRRSRSPGPRRS